MTDDRHHREGVRPAVHIEPESDRAASRILDEEIALHLALRVEQLVARGMSPADARAEAERRFAGAGPAERAAARAALGRSAARREERIRWRLSLDAMRRDVAYAARAMRRAPGFTAAAVLTLALGIGANSAVFSVVNAALLRPLPYAAPDRLTMVWNHWTNWPRTWLSPPEVYDYASRREAFSQLAAYSTGAVNLDGGSVEPERVRAGFVTASLLQTVGVRPVLGRDIATAEDLPTGAPVALLDHGLWLRRYAGDRSIVGRPIPVNGVATTVIGVLPADFRLPTEFAGDHAEIYLPLQLGPPNEQQRGGHYLLAVARLAPGVTAATAERRLNDFIRALEREHPDYYNPDFGVTLVREDEQIFGPVRGVLMLLLAAVAFVLLIACANVASLLLSRAEARQREIAIRAALGAGHRRLRRQLLTESLLLALAGGALALPLAALGTPVLVRLGASSLPRAGSPALDARVLLVTLGIALLTGLAFGLAPALHAVRGDLHGALRTRAASGGARGLRLRQAIVAVQVALAVVSVAGAMLMGRSFTRLMAVTPGFAADHALTMRISLSPARYRTVGDRRRFFGALEARLDAMPGVRSAGAINQLPLASTLGDWGLLIAGRPVPQRGEQGPAFDWQVATPGYFQAMKIALRRGRLFTVADDRGAMPVVVINETTARTWWPKGDAIGGRIRLGGSSDSVWRQVIGVVADVHHEALDKAVRSEMYLPEAQFPATVPDTAVGGTTGMTLVLRTTDDPARLAPAARAVVRSMDDQLTVSAVQTLDDVLIASVGAPRLAALLLGSFAALALVLSAIGIYGVMAYGVAQRRSEIGIRLALGGRVADVVRLVVWQGMRPALLGLIAGATGSLLLARFARGMVFGVSESDPRSLAAAVGVLALVALVATLLPARRVAAVDPIASLRVD